MHNSILIGAALLLVCSPSALAAEQGTQLRDVAVNGAIENGKARLTFEGWLTPPDDKSKVVLSASVQDTVAISRSKVTQNIRLTLEIIGGRPSELPLTLNGDAEVREVTGNIRDWSIRQEINGTRLLILRPLVSTNSEPVSVEIVAEVLDPEIDRPVRLLALAPPSPTLLNGYVKLTVPSNLQVHLENSPALIPIEERFLPGTMRGGTNDSARLLAYRFQGEAYQLPIRITFADPEFQGVALREFQLLGEISGDTASFTLTAQARVSAPRGGRIDLLSGAVALTRIPTHPDWRLAFENGRYTAFFDKPGEYAIQLSFDAALQHSEKTSGMWRGVRFQVAGAAVAPLRLRGLPGGTQFDLAEGGNPQHKGEEFLAHVPAGGLVDLAWRQADPETEGKLFFATEALSQVTVSPGLMRQAVLFDVRVMQGELSGLVLLLEGQGEVTRVQGEHVLSWDVTPGEGAGQRRLNVRLNQALKDQISLQVQAQAPLGSFPATFSPMRMQPEGATRFSGFVRVANEGAVRLEVARASGLTQVAPEQFPESDVTRAMFRAAGPQRFVYRFSGGGTALSIQADQISPEIAASELLTYRLAENDLSIDAEIELDVREAPLRELSLRIPSGYAIARLTAAGLNDYFVSEITNTTQSELRLVYGAPVSGRQLVQVRLEQNKSIAGSEWDLPPIIVLRVKSVRGHIGVMAEPGFRLTPELTDGLTEMATAFFPKKSEGLQAAFRLSDTGWRAVLRVERLPQSIQADVMHLFSIGEGVAYGSSVINYSISGAPISVFKVEISDEYFNVEFSGRDVRGWQKTNNAYLVQLHGPVSGPYTLLATYERPFKAQGETLAFSGTRPADAQSEQGHTLVVSAYQFEVRPTEVSASLLPLETGEVPAEYRLFFDAPILAAYRYTARPFSLRLSLRPLVQGDSLNQVVDRASLSTRISKEGQIITDAKYFVKNRGNPQFRISMPPGSELWSASVNGSPVVPVLETNASLIPLPQRADPDTPLTLELKLAARSPNPRRLNLSTPRVAAPVMLAEWRLEPDTGQRLQYLGGSLTPASGIEDTSGFTQLRRTLVLTRDGKAWLCLLGGLGLWVAAAALWMRTLRAASRGARTSMAWWAASGAGAAIFGSVMLLFLGDMTLSREAVTTGAVTLVAPVQQAGSHLQVEVANLEAKEGSGFVLSHGWPGLMGLALLGFGVLRREAFPGGMARLAGWMLLAWAALRWPNGALLFIALLLLFLLLQVALPALRSLWHVNSRSRPKLGGGAQGITSTSAVGVAALLSLAASTSAAKPSQLSDRGPAIAQTVIQEIRVDGRFARATVQFRWKASQGELLPLLYEPGVLSRADYQTNEIKLVRATEGDRVAVQAFAERDGTFEGVFQYELQTTIKDGKPGFDLPTGPSLVNEATLTIANLDVDVLSPRAVSLARHREGSNTLAVLHLSPEGSPWIYWIPRARDIKGEKPVFYADLAQIYAPGAGVVEGAHLVTIRPAQGELSELVFSVPAAATIVDVQETARIANQVVKQDSASREGVSLWRFDPDAGKLRVNVIPPKSKPFTLLVRSQVPAKPLPFEQQLGLLKVENSAGQLGYVGVASGAGVQLESVMAPSLSPINLEDFPAEAAVAMQSRMADAAVRRAFRYTDPSATLSIHAAPVEADVRAETQQTVSLGEDRVVVAASANVSITRAGIFRLSFKLPHGYDVESVSGAAMSHWTEARSNGSRIITLHLKGKTEGQQQFSISLAGPGVRATNAWQVPQFNLREADKQRGTLVLAPEQGMRLQAGDRESLAQLDPQKSGIPQKGVLAFRVLQTPWRLAVAIEQVDPWVQLTSLQHITVTEAQLKVAANLQYQIDNTGLKQFRLLLPTNAESVRFSGEQVADSIASATLSTNGLREWEVKLHRRVIGACRLQVNYQIILTPGAVEALIQGIEAPEINSHRGYLTVQSGGRLQAGIASLPDTLQPTEWQSVPKALLQDLGADSANLAYRMVEPAFEVVLRMERREAARLLAARVNSIGLNSVVADDGAMLTQARLEILPGDKRLLNLTLPADGDFWFAFVNQNGVWPWRDGNKILIPLEQQSRGSQPVQVEVFYTAQAGKVSGRSLDLDFAAPKFDLPLENITWRVILNEKWKVAKWSGSLQFERQRATGRISGADTSLYLKGEESSRQERTREAEQLLALGNSALQKGDPQQARRAFQSAFGLSKHDAAFNEDARVQLQNVKLQQAVIGLNYRNEAAAGEAGATANLAAMKQRQEVNYTQQAAKEILDRNTAEDNAALMKQAERIIQQQDAAVSSPAAIRASIPEQGRVLSFKRAVAVDPWADLRLQIEAEGAGDVGGFSRLGMLALIAFGAALFAWLGRRFQQYRA